MQLACGAGRLRRAFPRRSPRISFHIERERRRRAGERCRPAQLRRFQEAFQAFGLRGDVWVPNYGLAEHVVATCGCAAGIVLSAVAVELVPIISEAESTSANIFGITLGFTAGVALFITVGKRESGADVNVRRVDAAGARGDAAGRRTRRRRGGRSVDAAAQLRLTPRRGCV